MTRFAVPQEVQEQLKDTMKDNSGVKLPFAAPTMWWMNGKAAFKNEASITDARRFGGWGVSKEEIDELGIQPAPSWVLTDLTNAKCDSYRHTFAVPHGSPQLPAVLHGSRMKVNGAHP